MTPRIPRLLAIYVALATLTAHAQTPPPPPAPSAPPTAPESASPEPAPAQPAPIADTTPPVPPAVMEEAKAHYAQGVALFNDGNYAAALAEFEQTHKLWATPTFFYNIGLAQKGLFRYTEAIASLQRFLDEAPWAAAEQRAQATQVITEMKALLANVTFKVVPDNATILVDGRTSGTTPLATPLQIAAGMHKLEVLAEGYEPQKREVMITAGVPLALEFKLKLIPKTGKVRINASVPRATVSVDGRAVGIVPLELELDAGGHQIEVVAPKHEPRRDELVIIAGQTRQLDVRLDKIVVPKKHWYKQWYVWTGAAAVLVGGTAACGLAGCFDTQQAPLEGTLAPGAGGVQ